MDMNPRGNLKVGGRDAVYLYEAEGTGGFKTRTTIATLTADIWTYSFQVAGDDLYVLTVTALYRLPNVIRDPDKVTFERLVWGIPNGFPCRDLNPSRDARVLNRPVEYDYNTKQRSPY
jgi:hypothetical protein